MARFLGHFLETLVFPHSTFSLLECRSAVHIKQYGQGTAYPIAQKKPKKQDVYFCNSLYRAQTKAYATFIDFFSSKIH